MSKYLVLLSILLAVLLGAGLAPLTAAQGASCPSAGKIAPPLNGPDIAGAMHNLSDYKGKWVYVDFWATWCGPCMRALPEVVEMHKELAERSDFMVLGVSLDEAGKRGQLEDVTEDYRINYPVVYDGTGWLSDNARGWCVNAIPATFLIDPQGNIVGRDITPGQVQGLLERYSAGQLSGTAPIADGSGAPSAADALRMDSQLLSDSPSSGHEDLRDMQLMLQLPARLPSVLRYQLYLEFTVSQRDGALSRYGQRYEISISSGKSARTGVPYFIDIRDTSGEQGGAALLSHKGGSGALPPDVYGLPALSIAVDMERQVLELKAPVPLAASKLGYMLAVYDEARGQYITDGIHQF